ncbi:SLC13 family permease [soil metagenome]
MTDIILVCTIIVIALILFATEKLRIDFVAIMIMVALSLLGLFREKFPTPTEAVSGLSNTATVTVGAMFVLSAGLLKTGAVSWLSQRLVSFGGKSEAKIFLLLMITVGVVSAFMNNTAAVAIFLPVALVISQQFRLSPSILLLPLSYISIVGGTCTLIGTSTNILVSSMSANRGFGEFGMFELTKLGIIFFAVGLIYLYFVARPLLVRLTGLTRKYRLRNFLMSAEVGEDSRLIGKTPVESRLNELYDVIILEIRRGEERIVSGLRETNFQAGDILMVRGAFDNILQMEKAEGLVVKSENRFAEQDLAAGETILAEAVISTTSSLLGRTLKEANFRIRYGVFVLAIRKHGETEAAREKLGDVNLEVGDTLLLQGRRELMEDLAGNTDFLMAHGVKLPDLQKTKAIYAVAIIAFVIGLAALGMMPILISALTGCVLMILFGCITMQEAYDSIDWFVIFLLAGVIPLGIAMEKTGAAELIAYNILALTKSFGAVGIISVFFLVTTVFTSIMSNNAAAILLVPIGIASAQELGMSPMPFLMAITFAASTSLSTPFGYQTNLMVYGPGGYKFSDYLIVGIPLNIIFWILATIFIPYFWAF